MNIVPSAIEIICRRIDRSQRLPGQRPRGDCDRQQDELIAGQESVRNVFCTLAPEMSVQEIRGANSLRITAHPGSPEIALGSPIRTP
jgi:hypothetical protein